MTKEIGVGLIGFGVIGSQVARLLTSEKDRFQDQTGVPITLKKVKVVKADLERPLVGIIGPSLFTTDEDDFFATPGIDIVFEAIGGEEPAFSYLKRAIASGKQAVTSNKEVIAKHGMELTVMAKEHNTSLRYEASVGGGIPIITPLKRDLVANKIRGIYCIINGTTNYILTRMSKEDMDFASTLKSAQELGYAEPNPVNDIEGIDAAFKIAILATLAFRKRVRPEEVYHEGISRLRSQDFRYARELGFTIKLLAMTKDDNGAIETRVHPVLLPQEHPLAKVDGVLNAIMVDGDLTGQVVFVGQGAGPLPTSSAVVADVIAAAREVISGQAEQLPLPSGDATIKPMDDVLTRYYIRMSAADQPGVLAQIARVLGMHQISIASVIQKESDSKSQTAEIVIMTHQALERNMRMAIEEINELEITQEVSNFIRVEA